jgi:hypothetical protein
MKFRISVLILVAGCLPAICQDNSQQITAEFERSKVLAVKLYPDCTDANSALSKTITQMDLVAKANNSRLYDFAGKPLVYAIAAGASLKIQPNWCAVTEGERDEIFTMMVDGLVNTRDLMGATASQTEPAQNITNPGSAAPRSPANTTDTQTAQQSFNPGSMNPENNTPGAPTPQAPAPSPAGDVHPTVAGFDCFFYELQTQSHGLWGRQGGPPTYRGGPLGGMDKGEATNYAQERWEQMSFDQQMVYENKASFYGDPIAQQQAAAAAHPRSPTGATIYSSDGTVSQVQYH